MASGCDRLVNGRSGCKAGLAGGRQRHKGDYGTAEGQRPAAAGGSPRRARGRGHRRSSVTSSRVGRGVAQPVGLRFRHTGNAHNAAQAQDSGPEPDTARGAPRIPPGYRARCRVARPQRSARATARTLSPAARRRRVSPSRAARFSGAPVARSYPRVQPARFPPGPQPPVFGRQRQHGRRMPRQPRPPDATPGSPGSRAGHTIMVQGFRGRENTHA